MTPPHAVGKPQAFSASDNPAETRFYPTIALRTSPASPVSLRSSGDHTPKLLEATVDRSQLVYQ